jgi:outer membrane assembly lipoprotein YfiO
MYQNDNQYAKAADEYEFYAKAYAEAARNINFTVEDALYTRAVCLYNADQYQRTVAAVDSFVTEYPSSNYFQDLSYLKAVSLFNLKKFDDSKTGFASYIEKFPKSQYFLLANVFIGRIFIEQKKEAEAAAHFRLLLREHPGNKYTDDMNYYFIQAAYELKQYDSIPPAFNGIKPVSPYFGAAVIKAAKCYTLQKKFSEGEPFILRLVALADSLKDTVYFRPEANFAMADHYIATSKFETAVKHLTIVVEDKKTNELLKLQSTFLRGTLYGQVNKHKEAIADLEYVLNDSTFLDKFKPLLANARGRLATSLTKAGQVNKGTDLMVKYIDEAADSLEKARYLVALCELYFELKNFDKLILYGEKVFAMNVADEFLFSRTVYLTATAHNAKMNFPRALEMFSRAVEKYPEANQDIFFNFAVSLYDMSYYKNAAEAFAKYIAAYPKSPNVKNSLFFIGYAYFKLGEWELAVEGYRNFLKQYPEDSYAPESQYNIAEAKYNQGSFAEAVKEYHETYLKYPKSDYAANAVYNEGWSYYQLKEMDKMIEPLQKLIKDYPKHQLVAEAQFTIGDYFYNKKEYARALTEYRSFIERFPEHARTEEARSFIKELSQIDAFREYQKAIVFFDKQNWQAAIAELGKIVQTYPETEIAMACEANMASSYSQLKDMKKALELFKQIVAKYKDNPLASGVVYFAQQHIEWMEGNATASR